MDVPFAAMYAGVTQAVLTAAVHDGELRTAAPWSHLTTALVHSHAIEAWAAERESRFPLAS